MRLVSVLLLLALASCSEEKSACERTCRAACSKAVECLGGQGSCGAQCSDACEDGPHVVFGVDVDECIRQVESLTCDNLKSISTAKIFACDGILPAGAFGGDISPGSDLAEEQEPGFSYSWEDPQVAIKSLAARICDNRRACPAFEITCTGPDDSLNCKSQPWTSDECNIEVANLLFDENCFNLDPKDVEFLSSCILSLNEPSCQVDETAAHFYASDIEALGLTNLRNLRSVLSPVPAACEALLETHSTCTWMRLLPRLGLNLECSFCSAHASEF